ncbi:HAD family hydrolase [Psychrobacter sanguinis]|uniref:HAD family hydrolase n=1 Tax=Psychrobacter sanguinis TaxID=861445 RepID=UPI0019191B72|nr:HAD family hydrolase [Psychrobacter sanguinis]MCC3308153.1 HAD-IB family hydrolase [Psychrobacter sanguinis]UEC25432.1 HAD-IB family hydrolase [Psychrobacter sanguinis]
MHNQAANSSLNNQTEALNNGKELALFDLDHTLLDVDSDYLWGEYIVKNGLVDEAQYRTANQRFYEEYIEGTLDATEYNEFVAEFLTTLPLERLHDIREAYIKTEIEPHIRPQAIEAIQRHLEAGHDVVIISATNDFVVSAIAERFGIEAANVLATPLEVKDNRYTGKLTDKPNFKEGKIYHLNKWLKAKQEQGIHYSKTYGYSDSKNDLPLLEWADVPVAVTPDEVLHAHALAHRWAVEDWSIPKPN